MVQRHVIPLLDDALNLVSVLDHKRRQRLTPRQRRYEAFQNGTETAGAVVRVLGVLMVLVAPWAVGAVVLVRWAIR